MPADAPDVRTVSIRAVIVVIAVLLLGKAFHLQVVSAAWRTRRTG